MDPYYYENNHAWRKPAYFRNVCALFVLGFLVAFFSPSAHAYIQTKIVAINGQYNMNHAATIQVQAGDVVSFMADQVDTDGFGNTNPQNRRAEDFIWNSDIRSNDFCAPAWQDCAGSNFEMHQYGVNFYVPYNMPSQTTLTVINRNDGSYDQITLQYSGLVNGGGNSNGGGYNNGGGYGGGYSGGDYDYNSQLAGHGRWVYINGERVFVPYHYTSGWSPYQHGYWYWTSYGWTWYSYDPWGHVTDHYGYWRHHGVYGWIWFPFSGSYFTWHPAVVSFYYTSYGIGWSPYWSGYGTGYYSGYNHGYNDGYLDGYWDGYNHAHNHGHGNCGVTYVTVNNFYNTTNIYNVVETNTTVIQTNISNAIIGQTYGEVIGSKGGGKPVSIADVQVASNQLGLQTDAIPVNVVSAPVKGGGTVSVVKPVDVKPMPVQYQQAQAAGAVRGNDTAAPKVPVGSVVNPGNGAVVKPPVNVAVPPRKGDGSTVPATGKPPVLNPTPAPSNPGHSKPTIPSEPSEPTRPTKPTPVPSNPVPAPTKPNQPSEPSYPGPSKPVPSNPAPAPSKPTYPSEPSEPTRPTKPTPVPSNPGPSKPVPSNPAPAPSKPTYPSNPAPSKPSYPSNPAPAPSKPSYPSNPSPSKPSPAPSKPSNPGGGGGGGGHHPSPSRPSPSPSKPSNPGGGGGGGHRPSPSPSKPSPSPSKPSPSPSKPSPGRGGRG